MAEQRLRRIQRLRHVQSAIPDAVRLFLSNPAFSALVSALPEELHDELHSLRKHLLADLRLFSRWPVRKGILQNEHARLLAVFEGELREGASLLGVNLFKGSVMGGSIVVCNAALADVEQGEVRGVNLLAGTVRGGSVRAVNIAACDVYGGEIDRCGILAGNVFGGRVRTALLVGDVVGGDVEAVRHIGARFAP